MTDHDHTPHGGSPLGDLTADRPSGEVAFLFTDVQGSVRAWERHPVAMNEVIATHDLTVRAAIDDHGGSLFSIAGDAFGAAFHDVHDAVACVVATQRGLAAHPWPDGLAPQVRMGVHVGRAYERDGNYFGPAVNRAARIMAAGHGGQVLVSADAVDALHSLPDGVAMRSLGPHQLRDLAEPMVIHQLTIDDLPAMFPPLRALDPSDRISPPADAFVGRAAEMVALSDQLGAHAVITLLAAGGTGKTRLALEAVAQLAGEFPDGVYVVELADGTEVDVEPRVAEAVLGDDPIERMEGATDVVAALQRHLGADRVLLVLDNCEHVLGAAGRLVTALTARCPHLTVLTTSRERLGVAGEQVMPLSPLSTLPGGGGVSPAAELFLDRALAAHPELVLDSGTLEAIDAICHTVDGSPLAIELAASRVRTFTPQQIAARLGSGMQVLRQHHTSGPERHRSLESAIDWSHELLGRDERRLLAWCSVFVGGFDLEAAEAIGRAADIDEPADVLESLAEKSLVASFRLGDGMRYRLPEPIRQYAAHRLRESGHTDRALDAHFEHCASTARATVAVLDGPTDPPRFTRIAAERDNFLAAIHRATERGEGGGAMSLASSLDLWWAETGHLALALQTMEQLVRRYPDHKNTPMVQVTMLWVATMCGELPRALEVRQEVEYQLGEGRLSPGLVGGAAFGFGFIESALGDAAQAARVWGGAAAAAAPFAPAVARQAYWSAGQSATAAGDVAGALVMYDAAERLPGPAPGWLPGFIEVQRLVAHSYEEGADRGALIDRIDQGVAALENTGLRMRFLLSAAFAALSLFECGEPGRARHWWQRSMSAGREIGNLWACWVMLECAAWSATLDGDDVLAARFWQAADAFAAERGYGRWPVMQREGERRRDEVRARSPHAFDRAAAQRPMTLTEAVETALGPVADAGLT